MPPRPDHIPTPTCPIPRDSYTRDLDLALRALIRLNYARFLLHANPTFGPTTIYWPYGKDRT